MKLRLFKTLWGHRGSLAEAIAAARADDLAGLEGPAPATAAERREFRQQLAGAGLEYLAEICTAGGYVPERSATPAQHLASFQRQAEAVLECAPQFLTVIAGCDAWPLAQSVEFFAAAHAAAQKLGIIASFETHRGRSLFHPWITRDVLRALPELRLTCDFSHWCCVAERLVLDTATEVLGLCAERVHHIHARVGYAQGPQVPHPAAPEYRRELAAHERWWAQLWRAQSARGCAATTMTPEFGPDGYLHTLPFTATPVADLAAINAWMAARLRRRFSQWIASGGGPSGDLMEKGSPLARRLPNIPQRSKIDP